MNLTSSEEDSLSISVGEMKQKDALSVDNLGGNIRYFKNPLKIKIWNTLV